MIETLLEISPSKYVAVGLFLGLPYKLTELCELEDQHEDKIAQMADFILDNKCYESFGAPSWKKVVTAVAADDGGRDYTLAKKIAADHPQGW